LDVEYLGRLGELIDSNEPSWVSDHLCFGTVRGHRAYDLWPLPFTEEAMGHVVERLQRVQDTLGTRLLLEKCEFLREVVERADALILLDVNNVVVNAKNHGFLAADYVDFLPLDRVRQIHLSGHTAYATHAIDDHGSAVPDEVWELYRRAVRRFGAVATIVEWDENLPALDVLRAESDKARRIQREVLDEAG
jgi:uncharacterized protein (UPF0276 family)